MVLKDEFLEVKKNIEFGLSQVHDRKLKDIDMIMVPVQVAEQYFVIALNIKNKNIHILDSAKEDRGKDYYKQTVKRVVKTLARQYRHAHMRQRADMIEVAASKRYLVPLPCKSDVEEEYT
ncbi:hypothetical protein V2J09_005903 [Rumex salicifolius]